MSPIDTKRIKGRQAAPAPGEKLFQTDLVAGLFWNFLSVCAAAALALARVLCFAALVSGLASALAFAGVLAFTGVAILGVLRLFRRRARILAGQACSHSMQHRRRLNARTSGDQTRECSSDDQTLL